jgi:hypothetical protein
VALHQRSYAGVEQQRSSLFFKPSMPSPLQSHVKTTVCHAEATWQLLYFHVLSADPDSTIPFYTVDQRHALPAVCFDLAVKPNTHGNQLWGSQVYKHAAMQHRY